VKTLLLIRCVATHPVETALQFAGIPTSYLLARCAYPVAELDYPEWWRIDLEPLLHQALHLIAGIDHIADHPSKHSNALKRNHGRQRDDQSPRFNFARDHLHHTAILERLWADSVDRLVVALDTGNRCRSQIVNMDRL
jgi:hypothetical protein